MKITTTECVDCGLPCLFESCPYYKVVQYYCDDCKNESDELYDFYGEQLCADCLLSNFDKVE